MTPQTAELARRLNVSVRTPFAESSLAMPTVLYSLPPSVAQGWTVTTTSSCTGPDGGAQHRTSIGPAGVSTRSSCDIASNQTSSPFYCNSNISAGATGGARTRSDAVGR
eukprot:6449109-Prymnesium_polylepis.2